MEVCRAGSNVWQVTFMFYVASGGGSRHSSASSSSSRFYMLQDGMCIVPRGHVSLSRALQLQACLTRAVALAGHEKGSLQQQQQQQQQQQTRLLLKLREVAFGAGRSLHLQQLQQQQQQQSLPRMCGVMDWLVRFSCNT